MILGDSMLKDIESSKIRKGLNNDEKVYIKHFSGATVHHMTNYVKPTMEYDNDLLILHCGTNDLRSGKTPDTIAKEIIELATDIKTEHNDIMISGIVPRRDSLNNKGKQVNNHLKMLCRERNICFINNDNVDPNLYLNNGGLHLNFKGTYVLGGNLVDAIRL